MSGYKVLFVSPFPPHRSGISEFGGQLIGAFARVSGAEVSVLGDGGPRPGEEWSADRRIRIRRAWGFNRWTSGPRILRWIWRERPDVVWFNLIYSAFGDRRVPALLGFLAPYMARRAGFITAITLHHLMDFIDLSRTRFESSPWLTRWGSGLAHRLLFRSSAVFLPLEKYAAHARRRFPKATVLKMPLGFPRPAGCRSNLQGSRLLVMGRFGSYKRLDGCLETLRRVRARIPAATMAIAGLSHYSQPGYYEEFATRHEGEAGVEFLGYVPEEKLGEVLAGADLMVLNHSTTTGASAVALLAACHGLPVVSPALPDLLAMEQEEGIAFERYAPGDAEGAASAIVGLFDDRWRLRALADRNYAAAQANSIDDVARRYDGFFRERLGLASPPQS